MEAWSAELDPNTKHMLWYSLVVFGWSLNKRSGEPGRPGSRFGGDQTST
jgi:hypothetical protein